MALYKHKRYVTQDKFNRITNIGGLAIMADKDGLWTIINEVKYIADDDKAHIIIKQ